MFLSIVTTLILLKILTNNCRIHSSVLFTVFLHVVCIGHGGSCYNGGTRRPSAHISGYGDAEVNRERCCKFLWRFSISFSLFLSCISASSKARGLSGLLREEYLAILNCGLLTLRISCTEEALWIIEGSGLEELARVGCWRLLLLVIGTWDLERAWNADFSFSIFVSRVLDICVRVDSVTYLCFAATALKYASSPCISKW